MVPSSAWRDATQAASGRRHMIVAELPAEVQPVIKDLDAAAYAN